MKDVDMIKLLKDAQNGNEQSLNELLILIRDNLMGRRIGRYIGKNRQVDNEDIRQEFMIGVALNISKAKLDVGNPIEYLLAQGVYRVRSYMRSQIIKGTTQTCMDCGHISRLKMDESGKYVCGKCGSSNVTTQEVHNLDDGLLLNTVESMEDFEADLIFNDLMDKFEATLDRGTNIYQLYILLKDGINRNNPQIKNYIKEIACIWKCSQTNVVQAMDKLRYRLNKFTEEQGLEIVNNKFVYRR